MASKPKRVAGATAPPSRKNVPRRLDGDHHGTDRVSWRYSLIDWEGIWGWDKIQQDHMRIARYLKDHEGTAVPDIYHLRGGGSHPIDPSEISRQAQQRLTDLKLDDVDSLFSFRFSGVERLWGYFAESCFYFIWWDPRHEVYPALKQHT